MIAANELRLGNWVMFSPSGRTKAVKPRPVIVKSLSIKDFVTSDLGLPLELFYESASTQPIPLTAEILLACGFVKDKDGDYWIDLVTNYLKAMFMNDGVYPVWFCVAELSLDREQMASLNRIHSLHQLQNLYFALTGTELSYSPELLKPTNA